MFKLKIITILFTVLTFCSLSSVYSARLQVSPSSGDINVGEEVEVEIIVEDANNLWGFEIDIEYDSAVLELVEEEDVRNYLPQQIVSSVERVLFSKKGSFYDDTGKPKEKVTIGAISATRDAQAKIITDGGRYPVFRLKFRGKGGGRGNIHVGRKLLIDTAGNKMSVDDSCSGVSCGSFIEVKEIAILSVEEPAQGEEFRIGDEINVRVTIEGIGRLKGFQFGIMYNPDLLEFEGIEWNPKLNSVASMKLGPREQTRGGGYISQIVGLATLGWDTHYALNGDRFWILTAKLKAKSAGRAELLLDKSWAMVLVKDDYSENGFHKVEVELREGWINIAGEADLVVEGIKFYKPRSGEKAGDEVEPKVGELVTCKAIVKNVGNAQTGVFNVKWYLDGKQVGYGSHASLAPGEVSNGNVRFDWLPTAGTHTLRFVADADSHVRESNEDNNEGEVSVEVKEVIIEAPGQAQAKDTANRSERWQEEEG